MLSKTAPKSNLTVQIRFSASTALCNSALLSHLYSVLYSDLLGPKSASKPTKEHCQNTFSSIPYLRQLPAPVHFLSGWVGAGTSFKAQCFRPRPKSDFYTCKIREWIFEGLPFGSLGYLRETSRAREELILFLKTMQIFKIIPVERKGLPFFGKHYSGGVMLRNGKVSRAIGRYIGSWKYDKS